MSGLAERLRASLDAHGYAHSYDGAAHFATDGTAVDLDKLMPAAVLIAVIDAPEPRVLLTMRREDMRRHAGQVAFPGGRIDPEDAGPVEAALREAWEEVALPPERVEVVGTARPYITHSSFHITPVIGVIPDGLALAPHEDEVAALFEVPMTHLFSAANHLRRSSELFDGRQYYEIDWPDYRIWGVTAGIIVDLAPRLAGLMADSA